MPKLSIGVLGTAKIARTMVPHMNAIPEVTVVAVASRSMEKAQRFAAEFQVPHACGSYEDLLKRDDVDAVYIPLPPAMHCEWTIKAAEAGKHILCEKPVGISSAEVRHMIQAAQQNNVVLLDGVMWYHTSRARELKRLAEEGSLGELRQITSAFTFPGNVLAAENLRFSAQLGGGSLLDIGWYCVGVSLWMLNAMPDRVFAAAQWKQDVDVHMNGLMWFSEDRVASFESGFTAIRRRWVEICGSKAALVCDDFTRPWNADKPRFWLHDENGISHPHVCPHPPVEQCLVNAFCDLITRNEINHSWLQLSLNTQIVCEALLKSARSGSMESVPPVGSVG